MVNTLLFRKTLKNLCVNINFLYDERLPLLKHAHYRSVNAILLDTGIEPVIPEERILRPQHSHSCLRLYFLKITLFSKVIILLDKDGNYHLLYHILNCEYI